MPALKQWELDYWKAQPDAQVCRDCGKAGVKAYVQPQLPRTRAELATHQPYALCTDCLNAAGQRHRDNRKAQLAAMDRCEVDGCDKRGTWRAAGGLLLCGKHLRNAQAAHARACASLGGLALLMPIHYSRQELLNAATGANLNPGD